MLHALLALGARPLLLVQDPVALRHAALRLVAALLARAATNAFSASTEHARARGHTGSEGGGVAPTVPLLQDMTSSPIARGKAVGRPVMSTRKYFFACVRGRVRWWWLQW